jgi:hypothetical protein
MKNVLAAVIVVALLALVGCDKGTQGGASHPDSGKGLGEKMGKTGEGSFKLSVPTFSKSLQQGESRNVKVGITRGKNFDEDVTLKFEGASKGEALPKGITITPEAPTIKHSETEVSITIAASADAALGKHTIKVIGHPTKGGDATNEFTINIEKKK